MTTQETVEVETTPIDDAGGAIALSAVERAAIDTQVATAKQYPRSVDKALKDALTLATMDEDTAASCFYSMPRAGKQIEGPSARLAEIMVSSWGNIRADADIVHEDRTHITAVGTCFDVEKNVAIRVRVRRRITKKNGTRYDDDMIGVAGNAAISIALRNAVFKVIPQALVNRVYFAARKASIGQAGTITQKRQKALGWFAKAGVQAEQVFEKLGVRGLDDVGEEELITLRGMVTAVTSGEASIESMFRKHDVSDGAAELNEALGKVVEEQEEAILEQAEIAGNQPDEILEEMPFKEAPPGPHHVELETELPDVAFRKPGPRDKRQKDDLVQQCETHLGMLNFQKDAWLATARELKVDVPEKAASLKGLSVAALTDLEAKLRKEIDDG